MRTIIIDCGIGNRAAIKNMLQRIGVTSKLSRDPQEILQAQAIILPGIGAFDAFMQALTEFNLLEVLHTAVVEKRIPVLGICLGMQILFAKSAEGSLPGLGWLDGEVCALRELLPAQHKLPHIGWKQVESLDTGMQGIQNPFYFVHGYYCVPTDAKDIAGQIAIADKKITVAVKRDHIHGVQFHPEKSHKFGLDFFKEFINYAFRAQDHSDLTTR